MNKQEIKQIARTLRKNQTESENILWNYLRNRKLQGLKFIRQYPIIIFIKGYNSFYIADFYNAANHLILELDGKIHELQKERDT